MFLLLGRFAAVLGGYICAALAASAFLHVMLFATAGFGGDELPLMIAGGFIFSVPFVALFVAYFAFPASVAVILVTEIFALRHWLNYALGGGAVGAVVAAMMWHGAGSMAELGEAPQAAPDQPLTFVLIAGGIVGGLAYWLVAGRMAGSWRGGLTSPGPSGS